MESVFIEIPKDVFRMDKNIIVGTVCHPTGTNLDKFYNRMEEVIIRIQNDNKKCYIMGDYNINLMNYDMHTAEFTDMMYANSLGLTYISHRGPVIWNGILVRNNTDASEVSFEKAVKQCMLNILI